MARGQNDEGMAEFSRCIEEEAVPVMVTKEFVLGLLFSSENRTILKSKSSMSEPLATTALLGFAPMRSARASAATNKEPSSLEA